MPSDTSRRSAVSNALSSVEKDRRFPNNVLVGHWQDYLFFESYMMFDPCFIDVKSLLLMEEKASVIALINLGNVKAIDNDDPPTIFLEENTGAKEYTSELWSKGSPLSWMVLMDRYVCASDIGSWSIYCEKENDIAVFAFREGLSRSTSLEVERLLKARSVRLSSDTGDNNLFDFGKLLPNWRLTLETEYAPSRI